MDYVCLRGKTANQRPMIDNDVKRLSRLTAILTLLQSKRLLTATTLASKFSVSIRTIYRDIKVLEQAGVPIITEEGKGYSIMEGYRIPPVMFTESEANALITAEQIILKNRDASFVTEYSGAINKIKSILRNNTRDKADLLSNRIVNYQNFNIERTSNHLTSIQMALTNLNKIQLNYCSADNNETKRMIEPFALYYAQENWVLIAWCHLRNAYREFRLDRIQSLVILNEKFEAHKISLQTYFDSYEKKIHP